DGALIKAMAGRTLDLILSRGVDTVLTYYVDPHAYAAQQARRAAALFGRDVVVLNSVEGSDLFASFRQHLDHNEAHCLLGVLLDADHDFAVSEFAMRELEHVAGEIAGPAAVEALVAKASVRLPGLLLDRYAMPSADERAAFRARFGLTGPVVSTIGRV